MAFYYIRIHIESGELLVSKIILIMAGVIGKKLVDWMSYIEKRNMDRD